MRGVFGSWGHSGRGTSALRQAGWRGERRRGRRGERKTRCCRTAGATKGAAMGRRMGRRRRAALFGGKLIRVGREVMRLAAAWNRRQQKVGAKAARLGGSVRIKVSEQRDRAPEGQKPRERAEHGARGAPARRRATATRTKTKQRVQRGGRKGRAIGESGSTAVEAAAAEEEEDEGGCGQKLLKGK